MDQSTECVLEPNQSRKEGKMYSKGRALLIVVLLLTVALFVMAEAETEELQPQYGGTVTIAAKGTIFILDLQMDCGALGDAVLNNVHEGLLGVDDEGNIIPMLAVSLPEVLDGGRAYIFRLRRGVKFHDGTDFTAEDVKYTYERMIDPLTATGAGRMGAFVEGVEVLDRYLVKINMKEPWVDFLGVMAIDSVQGILSRTAVEKWGEDYGVLAAVGTGPFKFGTWEEGVQITLVRNENYWQRGLPYLDKLVFKTIPEDATRALSFRAGQSNVLLDPPFADMADFLADESVTVHRTGGGTVVQVDFNTLQAPVNDKRIRQALSMAIDRKTLVEVAYSGYAEPATSIFPSWSEAYTGGEDPYNPDEARRLLKEAGYSTDNPLTLNVLVRAEPMWIDAATAIQAMWAEVGVVATMEPRKAAGLFQMMNVLDPGYVVSVFRLGYGPPTTDYSFRTYHSSQYLNQTGYNKGGATNPRVDELLKKAAMAVDVASARDINAEISRTIFLEDVPLITVCFLDNIDVTNVNVKNWHLLSLDYLARTFVWVEQ